MFCMCCTHAEHAKPSIGACLTADCGKCGAVVLTVRDYACNVGQLMPQALPV